jgi:hypothetical protein
MNLRTVPLLRLRLDLPEIGLYNAKSLGLQQLREPLPSYQVQEGYISFN